MLACVARDPEARLPDIAALVGVTERAVQRILGELEDAKVVRRARQGRRNHYEIDGSQPLRHPMEANHTVAEFRRMLEP